jgi:hypothetical protein
MNTATFTPGLHVWTGNGDFKVNLHKSLSYVIFRQQAVNIIAKHDEDCSTWGAQGVRPQYCLHGTNQWTDYDNICGACEDSLFGERFIESYARDRDNDFQTDLKRAIELGDLERLLGIPRRDVLDIIFKRYGIGS